jgi:alpha-N-arabinofuranosidase
MSESRVSNFAAAATTAIACATMAVATPAVRFESFDYNGSDAVFAEPLAPGHFRNPVLAGFYPDPDICRVGDDYYIVNSSFAYFPGIPVFHSTDLVNWIQVGNAVDRPRQLNYAGLGVSRGIFAPALSHHGGLFYLIGTFVDAGGNFVITATDPAGPWSDPTWLGFDGIDPSIFWDDDGRAWVVSNGVPPDNNPMYAGHRAIYLQEFNAADKKQVGPRRLIINGGVSLADNPVWIEGPHLFKRDEWYYLICAEGGTAEQHSEVVFRSRNIAGPYVPGPQNPILTQRDLPDAREHPVTSTGHAELVETDKGEWWSVFLGCRPYAKGKYNTGRETFMLPVSWSNGWPSILQAGLPVTYSVPCPAGVNLAASDSAPLTGNFSWHDDFRGTKPSYLWIGLRELPELRLDDGGLWLTPSVDALWEKGRPAFIGRRLQHARFTASTTVWVPSAANISAGLVAFQNETHHYFLGVRQSKDGPEAFVERIDGGSAETVARSAIAGSPRVSLRMIGHDEKCEFAFSTSAGKWTTILSQADATLLSTQVAGGFVGTIIGLHARIRP